MYFEKQLSPLTNILRSSSKMVNLILIILLVSLLFPIEDFFPSNPIKVVEGELISLFSNPAILSIVTIFIYCVYLSGNETMLVLTLYIIHRLVLHGGNAGGGGAPSTLPPTARTTPPPPKPKAAPPPKPKAAPPPKPKAAPPPKPKAAPPPKPKAAPPPKPKAAPPPKPKAAPPPGGDSPDEGMPDIM